ncbi:hypothetical protein QCD71_18080, partial [Sphingomonas sp. PsM26]|nr:hypothetical protein [Sphingomonas sp. PsM26]
MTRHVPAPVKLTTPAAMVQTLLLVGSIVNVTLRLDVAVALGVKVAPPTTAATGAVDVKPIV